MQRAKRFVTVTWILMRVAVQGLSITGCTRRGLDFVSFLVRLGLRAFGVSWWFRRLRGALTCGEDDER